MDMRIDGLRVLVTAGAAGIGLVTARAFAAEGAKVLICDVDEKALAAVAASDPGFAQIVCDVADPKSVTKLFATVTDKLGGLDALINNAGIAGPTAPCEAVTLDDWQRTIAVNLTGQFLCAQKAIPLLKKSANGSIANLSSAAGRFGYPMRTPYASSKWAVVGFTKSLAGELGPFGVRVNAICPGLVSGPRIENVLTAKAAARGVPVDVVRAEGLARTSLRRFVTAADIADAIVFLASPSGRNISGHALPIDGDLQSLM
ncbi:MAG TPA: SDR family oxidoreductase [Casimicrobiaceae bacterium]|nr:SDR family oxidoreductase [Casimicrobiaceae bacterium]